jgi:hypothetical protein
VNKFDFEMKSDNSNEHCVGRATSIHAHISSVTVKIPVGLKSASNKSFSDTNITFLYTHFFLVSYLSKQLNKSVVVSVDNKRVEVIIS